MLWFTCRNVTLKNVCFDMYFFVDKVDHLMLNEESNKLETLELNSKYKQKLSLYLTKKKKREMHSIFLYIFVYLKEKFHAWKPF